MGKYFIAFALSYLAALLVFAVMGTVSLFRWPVGPVPGAYSFLWTLLPLAAAFLGGLLFAKRWASAVGTFAPSGLIVLLVVMSVLTFLARQTPLTAPGQTTAAALSVWLAVPPLPRTRTFFPEKSFGHPIMLSIRSKISCGSGILPIPTAPQARRPLRGSMI